MTLRPIDELLYPPPVLPEELEAVGTLDGKPWHASPYLAVPGPPPPRARQVKPERAAFDFGTWIDGHEWHTAKPIGWWYKVGHREPVITFSPEWHGPKETGFLRNYANGRYFRAAVRLGAVRWEFRSDGMLCARTAHDEPVALIACMRLQKGKS